MADGTTMIPVPRAVAARLSANRQTLLKSIADESGAKLQVCRAFQA